jgi:hypothetical protein
LSHLAADDGEQRRGAGRLALGGGFPFDVARPEEAEADEQDRRYQAPSAYGNVTA